MAQQQGSTSLRTKSGKLRKATVRRAEEALKALFPTVTCSVAPNGSNEIWVKDPQGYGFALTFGAGKAGVSATIRKFTGGPAVSVTGNLAGEMEPIPMVDAFEVSACVYRHDAYSQQFKRWYSADSEQRKMDDAWRHPSELGMEAPERYKDLA